MSPNPHPRPDRFSLGRVCPLPIGVLGLSFSLGLGIMGLMGGNLVSFAAQEEQTETAPETSNETNEDPLGLELWLSGEEPGPVETEPAPDIDPALTGSGGETSDPTSATASPPVTSPELSLETPEHLSLEETAPSLVIEERASGCSLKLNGQGTIVSDEGNCAGQVLSGETLGNTLEQQWQQWYGESGHDALNGDQSPISPLQVGVQAIGSAMQVSPFIADYYFQTERPAPVAGVNDRHMLFPLKSWAPITSVFGWRTHPISQTWRLHTGTDLGALWGTPVVAAFSGTVEVADVLDGYGVTVVLHHGDRNQQTLYAHLSEVFVKPGESLKQGEVLGRVGSTGNSTGPHLHFELREWQGTGWVALDAGAALASAQVGSEEANALLASASAVLPPMGTPAGMTAPNALQQWISWFLQVLSTLA
jgi:murein DD-endopeptidase MepM/ murein hydrolase activator NlpD